MTDQTPPTDDSQATAHRPVRSFVIRGGRATVGQQRALDELWPVYGVEYSPTALDLDALFARPAPRMLEIGFGAGEALAVFAKAHPELNCIGIEVHRPGVGHLLLEAQTAQLTNLRVICHDAVEVLKHQLPPGSIDVVHIFFPDPWHKKRHHKRRLIQPAFMEVLARVMRTGGTLRLATDWEHYAYHMREVIDALPLFINTAGAQGFVERSVERTLTRFERRGQRLGHGVWDLCYQRTAAPVGDHGNAP